MSPLLRVAASIASAATLLLAAPQGEPPRPAGPPEGRPDEGGWRFADGPRSGPGMGPGGGIGRVREVVKDFDQDGNHRLDRDERRAARAALKASPGVGRRGPGGPGGQGMGPRGGRGPGGPGGMGAVEPGRPGPKVAPADVPEPAQGPLYDPRLVRTLFLDFEDEDWEAEMADFYHTDVDVPATLTVDGQRYPSVGVRFRGASSFFAVPAGSKRSLNVSLDWASEDQRLLGYKTLNLLNSHEDPSLLHTVLYFQIARHYTQAPQANFVRVVINGESWGVYVSAQQFDKKLLSDCFGTTKGTRWKVQGSPNGQGGLDYVGEDVARYRQRYTLKSDEDPAAWQALVTLCRTLCQTPAAELEKALAPLLDIDSALWLLALENVLVNNDGYWVRASDYAIWRDPKGKFHLLPHDANETFSARAGFGGRPPGMGQDRGPGAQGGIELDPLVGLDDERKPLRSKLLAVPALRSRYLGFVKRIADEWLDWSKLGPVVAGYRALLEPEVAADTRKLSSLEAFREATSDRPSSTESRRMQRGPRAEASLREFAEKRRAFLLAHPALER